ncbi:cyclin-A1-4-like [Telopea speciosissima]|uniref:cyclin-A1-4-like n=1 Tax=Telopea speciosissima TaxID=54955 RepID=UPI001CC43F09|nr:cyclin-A1-4-like [Telopea speciosissima]
MSSQNRRSSLSTPSSSAAKRPASLENATKVSAVQPLQAKKRPALSNLTNQNNLSRNTVRPSGAAATQAPSATKTAKIKKVSSDVRTTVFARSSVPESSFVKSSTVVSCKHVSVQRSDGPISSYVMPLAPCSMDISPSQSDGGSVSLDEMMSTCDSLKSSDIEYIDNADASAVAFIERRTCNNLYISDHIEPATGDICRRDIHMEMDLSDKIVEFADNYKDPQLCATIACDIYKHLRASETKKRPSTNFMEEVQRDINASMRAIMIDWLVEVAEEYRLVPDTLYLTVNYIDRYLSGNVMNRQRLQLLGVACMMIAAKYEEICAPQVEEFCYITDNTYFKEEVLQMEAAVLNYLKFEMTAPTVKCFLRRFVRAVQGSNEVSLLQLECLTNYLAELSLLEYGMLRYAPSLIAASAIFLANFILHPSKRPWNATVGHYTLYKPSELRDCVKALHHLACNSHNTGLPAIKEKYSQHKYKFVAKKCCPPSVPPEYFQDSTN